MPTNQFSTTTIDTTEKKMKRRSLRIVSIEGNIGAGKTTVVRALQALCANTNGVVRCVEEPVDMWREHGILEAMYNGTMSSSTFQVSALVTLFTTIYAAIDDDVDVLVTERSMEGNKALFAPSSITTNGDQSAYDMVYMQLVCMLMNRRENVAFEYIYLQTSVELAHERIRNRARTEEQNRITLDYLHTLHQRHETFLQPSDHCHVICNNAQQHPDAIAHQIFHSILRREKATKCFSASHRLV